MTPVQKRRWSRLVSGFAGRRILVIGDLMLDRFVWGDVRRISPEAPVPVVRVTRESEHLGGAGNVVANLASLGAKPVFVGWVGRDEAGRRLARLLEDLGVDASGLLTSKEVETIEKTRILAHGQQVVRLDRESSAPGARLSRRLLAAVEERLSAADAVLVSDYGKGAVDAELLERLREARSQHDFAYLVDPKHKNFDHYRGATLVKPNENEAAAASGVEIADAHSLALAGRDLLSRWASESVLISRGENGISLFRREGPARHFPAAAREVFDVTGAGDTVMAVAALVLAAGGSLEDVAGLANLAAAIVVGKVGTATVGRRELSAAIRAAGPAGRERRR